MTKFVSATYGSEAKANVAVQALLDAHVPPRDMTVAVSDGGSVHPVPLVYETRTNRSAFLGVTLGVFVGAVLGATGAIPGLSPSIPLATVQMAVLGAGIGLLLGAVRGIGWWRQHPDLPKRVNDHNGVVVGVSATPERVEELRPVFERTGGRDLTVTNRGPEEQDRDVIVRHFRQHSHPR